MERRELREQNELADSLIAKLERIKALWDEMPDEAQVAKFDQQIGSIADNLERAKTTWNSHEFPGIEGGGDTLDVYERVTGAIADNLERTKTTWNSDEFPGIEDGDDTLDVYEMATANIAYNLEEVAQFFGYDQFPGVDALEMVANETDRIANSLR